MVKPVIEVCVESYDEAVLAHQNGADRIELCSNLDQDGLSPSFDLFHKIKKQIPIPVAVMIRPRAGNFIYSEAELDQCKCLLKEFESADAFVFGASLENGRLNIKQISSLAQAANDKSICIHKCIDESPAILKDLDLVKSIGNVRRVLSSGGQPSAWQGRAMLKEMIAKAKNELQIMPGGKITISNFKELHQAINAQAYHGRKIL